eukprot:TRINITY_DN37121_c0_g1_i1.p1 TRINITY_DN37121_c0_g1~~TRINITY_DN37121_c0_g1_i1.p1  ORF type:complete len:486 (+),score=120.33 TRINITY_DN37121_c0_g1_i1:57-1514(+)
MSVLGNMLLYQQQQFLLEQQKLVAAQMLQRGNLGMNGMSPVGQANTPLRSNITTPVNKREYRSPLSEMNSLTDEPVDDLRGLISKERLARSKIQRMEVTESARLEMQLQNLNIKKNGSKVREEQEAMGVLSTPKKGDVNREYGVDGKPIYNFKSGTPGGMCAYFLKGFCSLGNRCRYVHDDMDDGRFLKVTGMPYDATPEMVIDFFKPLQLAADKIFFIVGKEGKPTGSAVIEFRDRNEALVAQSKDRKHITESRYVLLYPSSRKEKLWHTENAASTAAAINTPSSKSVSSRMMPQTPIDKFGQMSPLTPIQQLQYQSQIMPCMSGMTGSMTSSPMGLTPSPLSALRGAVGAPTPTSSKNNNNMSMPPVLLPDDDQTTRSLFSEDAPTPNLLPKSASSMSNNDWLVHLQNTLDQTDDSTMSIPNLVVTPTDTAVTKLLGIGYTRPNCDNIIRILEELGTKTKLPFEDKAQHEMPSLLPMGDEIGN